MQKVYRVTYLYYSLIWLTFFHYIVDYPIRSYPVLICNIFTVTNLLIEMILNYINSTDICLCKNTKERTLYGIFQTSTSMFPHTLRPDLNPHSPLTLQQVRLDWFLILILIRFISIARCKLCRVRCMCVQGLAACLDFGFHQALYPAICITSSSISIRETFISRYNSEFVN